MEELTIYAQRANFSRFIEVQIANKEQTHIAAPITMVPHEPHLIVQPAFTLHPNAAQGLFDDLWRMGIRPSNGTGDAGQLSATQAHLNDMRQIAFKKLGMEPKNQ